MIKRHDYIHNSDCVSSSIPERGTGISKNRNQDVFFNIEWPWIERELCIPKSRDPKRRRRKHLGQKSADRQCRDLNGDHRNDERLRPVAEEGVEKRQDNAGQQSEKPHSEGPYGERGIVFVRYSEANLFNGGN